ncbi:FAD-dependent monooxygenase [Actinoplanes sp. G11-F43]|uniref:FAD-dependent monooxygenase n=1 Tax=Actinoplanes sp. G11-F43 TaxID=3424130 RepID=UPI003D3545DC
MIDTDAPVLVVGAGPTGAVLALELARHGVPSLVVERSSRPPRHSGPDLIGGTAAGILERLGVAGRVLAGGVDAGARGRVEWSRAVGGPPVVTMPSPLAGQVTGIGLVTRLRAVLRDHPLIDLREGWTFTGSRHTGGRTVATVLNSATGTRHDLPVGHLAGCDGARSTVRRCLGVPLEDTITTGQYCSVDFRSDALDRRFPRSSMIMADGISLVRCTGPGMWTGHLLLDRDSSEEADPAGVLHSRLPAALAASQVLGVVQWHDPLGVARVYGRGTTYLAGQSAHPLHPPSALVDTCLADAADLGGRLAAAVNGGPGPLDGYQRDRRPHAVRDRERLSRALDRHHRFAALAATGASPEQLAGVLRDRPQDHVNT